MPQAPPVTLSTSLLPRGGVPPRLLQGLHWGGRTKLATECAGGIGRLVLGRSCGRSSGRRLRPRTCTRVREITAPRRHRATPVVGRCLPPVPICVPSCSDPSSSVCSARQRAGTAGQRAVPGPHCRPSGVTVSPLARELLGCRRPPPPAVGLCPPLDLEVGSLLPVCRRPWGQASDSVQLTGRGHASGDAMLFLVLTSGPWPAPRAASCEGEQAVCPVAPPGDAAGGTPPTHSSALAAPAPAVWESPFPDGPPAGAARRRAVRPACLPSPGGHRGGCRLFDDTTSEPRARATHRGASPAWLREAGLPLRAQHLPLCSAWPNPMPGGGTSQLTTGLRASPS